MIFNSVRHPETFVTPGICDTDFLFRRDVFFENFVMDRARVTTYLQQPKNKVIYESNH